MGPSFGLTVVQHAGEKRTGSLVYGILKELGWRALFEDSPFMDEYRAIRDFPSKAHFVGHDDHSHPGARQFTHNVQHLADHFRIKAQTITDAAMTKRAFFTRPKAQGQAWHNAVRYRDRSS